MNGNGVYAIVKSNAGTKAMYIEEEVLEYARLNARTEQRLADVARVEAENAIAAQNQAMAIQLTVQAQAKADRRKEIATRRLILQELKVLTGAGVVVLGMKAGLVAIAWAIPVLTFFQAVIFFKAGKFFGKYFPRWFQL